MSDDLDTLKAYLERLHEKALGKAAVIRRCPIPMPPRWERQTEEGSRTEKRQGQHVGKELR